MKPTWYRADASIGKTHEPGYWTAFLKYDLRCWTAGFRFEPDDCWLSFHFECGPFEVEICYWRHYVAVLDLDAPAPL
jgi:hypothetical protein